MPEPVLIKAIYTDGACSGNPGPGGWSVVVQLTNGQHHELGGSAIQTTNNQMELQAAIEAVKALKTLPQRAPGACVYTDSEYVKNGITKWLTNWKKRDWKTAQGKPVLNQELWKALDALNPLQIGWQYVKAHAGHPGNERADTIARAFSLRQSPRLAQMDKPVPSTEANSPETSPTAAEDTSAKSDGPPDLIQSAADAQLDPPSVQPVLEGLCSLHRLTTALQAADLMASQGFLITSSELAELMGIHHESLSNRENRWVWRNWQVSKAREDEGATLWQLERIYPAPKDANPS